MKLSSKATHSARHECRYSSTFSRSFYLLSLSAFYPAHPCGTANVSQGLPGTRTVTKWNGCKNEWKTIKEGSGRGQLEGAAKDQKRWWKKEERRSGEKNGRSTT